MEKFIVCVISPLGNYESDPLDYDEIANQTLLKILSGSLEFLQIKVKDTAHLFNKGILSNSIVTIKFLENSVDNG